MLACLGNCYRKDCCWLNHRCMTWAFSDEGADERQSPWFTSHFFFQLNNSSPFSPFVESDCTESLSQAGLISTLRTFNSHISFGEEERKRRLMNSLLKNKTNPPHYFKKPKLKVMPAQIWNITSVKERFLQSAQHMTSLVCFCIKRKKSSEMGLLFYSFCIWWCQTTCDLKDNQLWQKAAVASAPLMVADNR